MNGDGLQIQILPVILGLVTLIAIIIGIFGVVVNFETIYDPTVTNYTAETDGLLINGTTHQQVATTSGMFATISPNMVWMLILLIIITIIYGVHSITKRKRGKLITGRRRL